MHKVVLTALLFASLPCLICTMNGIDVIDILATEGGYQAVDLKEAGTGTASDQELQDLLHWAISKLPLFLISC